MPVDYSGEYIHILSFFSFALSVIAAVLAIDMFRLLRTGELGRSWRVLIIASVIFAFMQALRMAEFFDLKALNWYELSQVAELMFVLALAYAFFLQRKAFADASSLRRESRQFTEEDSADETGEPDDGPALDADWSRFSANDSSAETTPLEPLPITVDGNASPNDLSDDSPALRSERERA